MMNKPVEWFRVRNRFKTPNYFHAVAVCKDASECGTVQARDIVEVTTIQPERACSKCLHELRRRR